MTAAKKCKFCDSEISSASLVCPTCGFAQRLLLSHALGKSIPLVAATVSTLLLVGSLLWPMAFPERAKIMVDTASPAYALNELRLDIANLSDRAVLLPSEMHCGFSGDADYLLPRMNTVITPEDGDAYSMLALSRTPDSAVGLRNQSARVRYAVPKNETWGAPGTRGRLNCDLRLADVYGNLEAIRPQVVFEINDGGIILYDIGNFIDAETMEVNAGTFFGPRRELLPSSQ